MSEIWNNGKILFKKDKYDIGERRFTVEGEWLDGKPHGICIIEDNIERGIMTLTHGKLNGGPHWFVNKNDGKIWSW